MTINSLAVQGIREVRRISFGTELLSTRDPFAPYLKRVAYRMGLTYQPYFCTDPEGNTITEISGSIGFGLPMLMNSAVIDIALMFGKRGSLATNGLEENLFRIALAISGGEKWFIRSTK